MDLKRFKEVIRGNEPKSVGSWEPPAPRSEEKMLGPREATIVEPSELAPHMITVDRGNGLEYLIITEDGRYIPLEDWWGE